MGAAHHIDTAARARRITLQAFDVEAAPLLDELRAIALRCRSAAQCDLFEACAVLSSCPQVARAAYAEALIRGLGPALGRAPVLHRPGVQELSFDEAWLLRTLWAARTADRGSFAFLIRARVPQAAQRMLGYLIVSTAELNLEDF